MITTTTRANDGALVQQRLANFSGLPTAQPQRVPSFALRQVAADAAARYSRVSCLQVRFTPSGALQQVRAAGISDACAVGDDLTCDPDMLAELLTQAAATEAPAWCLQDAQALCLYLQGPTHDSLLLYEV